jgi:probable HAF family extracellular repeat protein
VAFAINDRGQAVGASGSCGPFNSINQINLVPTHAVLWQKGKPIDLGNLGGDGHFNGIFATGLNNLGQVVGVSDTTGDTSFHAFLWKEGHMTDLGTLPGDSYSYATAISDRGQVVGLSLDANFNLRAAIWQNGNIANLNDFVPAETTLLLQTACSINGKGQIIGIALAKGTVNDYHAYLATPIIRDVESDNATPD